MSLPPVDGAVTQADQAIRVEISLLPPGGALQIAIPLADALGRRPDDDVDVGQTAH